MICEFFSCSPFNSSQDGTPIQQTINGPSVWATCVRGKEKQAVGELYDLFEQYAVQMWPNESSTPSNVEDEAESGTDGDGEGEEDIEKQIAKEMSSMKRPRTVARFGRFSVHSHVSAY